MSREYVLSGQNLTLANAAHTLAFINPGTTASLEILRIKVSQSHSSTSGMQRLQVVTQVTAFPTLVSATPRALHLSDPVSLITGATTGAAGTCGVNASAEGAGTKTVLWETAFNVLNEWIWIPTPRETIVLNAGASSGLGVYLPAAAADLAGWNVVVFYAEL